MPFTPPSLSALLAGSSDANDNSSIRMSCHRCKTTKEAMHLLHCHTQADRSKKRKRCRKKYCDACLKRCYDIDIATVDRATWICPACVHLCPCTACQRTAIQKDGLSPPIRAFVLNQPVDIPSVYPSLDHPIINDPCPALSSPHQTLASNTISPWIDNFIPSSFCPSLRNPPPALREENSSNQNSIISASPSPSPPTTSYPSGPPAVDSSLLALLLLLLLFKEVREGSQNNTLLESINSPNINKNNGFTLPPPPPTATTTTATTTSITMNSTLDPFHLNHPSTTPFNVSSNRPFVSSPLDRSPSPFSYNHFLTPSLFAPTTTALLSSNDLLLLSLPPPSASELSSCTPAALAAYQQQLLKLQEHVALLQRHVAAALATSYQSSHSSS